MGGRFLSGRLWFGTIPSHFMAPRGSADTGLKPPSPIYSRGTEKESEFPRAARDADKRSFHTLMNSTAVDRKGEQAFDCGEYSRGSRSLPLSNPTGSPRAHSPVGAVSFFAIIVTSGSVGRRLHTSVSRPSRSARR